MHTAGAVFLSGLNIDTVTDYQKVIAWRYACAHHSTQRYNNAVTVRVYSECNELSRSVPTFLRDGGAHLTSQLKFEGRGRAF